MSGWMLKWVDEYWNESLNVEMVNVEMSEWILKWVNEC